MVISSLRDFQRILFLAAAAIVAVVSTATGVPIDVPNSSFESPTRADGAFSNGPLSVPGWTGAPATGITMGVENPFSSRYAQDADVITDANADGRQYGYLNTFAPGESASFTSDLLTTVSADTTYTLTVSVGRGLNIASGSYAVEILAGGEVVASNSLDGSTIPGGSFMELTATYESPASGGAVGGELRIRLTHSNSTGTSQALQGHFDKVRMEASESSRKPAIVFGSYPETDRQPPLVDMYASDGSLGGVIYTRRNARRQIIGVNRAVFYKPDAGFVQIGFDKRGRPTRLASDDGAVLSFHVRRDGSMNVVGRNPSGKRVRMVVTGFEDSVAQFGAELMAAVLELRAVDFSGVNASVRAIGNGGGVPFPGTVPVSRFFQALYKVANVGLDVALITAATATPGVGWAAVAPLAVKLALDTYDLVAFANRLPPYETVLVTVKVAELGVEAAESRRDVARAFTDRRIKKLSTRLDRLGKATKGLFDGALGLFADGIVKLAELYRVIPSAGSNGAISPASEQVVQFMHGVLFVANAESGYVVDEWLVNGAPAQSGGITFTLTDVTEDSTVHVTFTRNAFTVTPTAGANGSINPSSPQVVARGSDLTFTAMPNVGYVVNQWVVGGLAVQEGGNSYTLANIQSNAVVQVTFKPTATSFTRTGPIPTRSTTIISAETGGNVPASVSGSMTVSYDAGLNRYTVSLQWALTSPAFSGSASYSAETSASGPPPATIGISVPASAGNGSGAEIGISATAGGYTGSVTLNTKWQTTFSGRPTQSGFANTSHSVTLQ